LQRQRSEQQVQRAELGRLRDVVVEAGVLGTAAVFLLAPAGQGDQLPEELKALLQK
jgi:hypothetical protein